MKRRITERQIFRYRNYLENEEKSRATIEKYIRDIRRFRMFLAGRRINREQVLAYKRNLIDSYKAVSVNSMLAALNGYLTWQGLEEMKAKPLKIQRKIFVPKEKELTKEDYNKLLNAAKRMNNERLDLIMQTICATGIRVSELSFITTESLKEGYIQVSCKNKTRYIWIPDQLGRKLGKYIKKHKIKSGPVFITSKGKSVNRSFIWKQMKKAAAAAGVDGGKVYPHNLRHLFARTFYELNRDVIKLSDILGHSSIETTRIYTMTSSRDYGRYLDRLDLVSGNT